VTLLARYASITSNLFLGSDAAQGPLLGSTIATGHAGNMFLEENSYISNLWADALVAKLPFHEFLWEAFPYLFVLAAAVGLAVTVSKLAGARAGWIAAVLGICLAPAVLLSAIPQTLHTTATANAVLLGIAAVSLARRQPGPRALLWYGVLGVVTGVDLASDPLLWGIGIAPFLLATAAAVRMIPRETRRQVLRVAAQLLLITLICGAATVLIGAATGIKTIPASSVGIHPGSVSSDLRSFGFLISAIPRLAGRPITDASVGTPATWFAYAIAVAILVLVVAAIVKHFRSPADPARTAHLVFWVSSSALLLIGYVFTEFAQDSSSIRYLTTLVFAAAALVPLAPAMGRWWGRAAMTTAMIYGVLAFSGIALRPVSDFQQGSPDLRGLASFLQAQGLHKGYASYWDANPITYITDGEVKVRQVMQGVGCTGQAQGSVCPYPAWAAQGWYSDSGGSTFLITRPGALCMTGKPNAYFGAPAKTLQYQEYTIYVYPYDISLRFMPARYDLCPPDDTEPG